MDVNYLNALTRPGQRAWLNPISAAALFCTGLALLAATGPAQAQPGAFSKEQLIEFSPDWKGERFPDGRPRVADEILQRMKPVSIEEAWSVLRRHGYNQQFEGNWVL